MHIDWALFYEELKDWQGAISSIFGFTALIAAALFNFNLNRKRDQRLRHEEIIATASALYGEIVIQRRSLARMANAVANRYFSHGLRGQDGEPFDKHFVASLAPPPLMLYPTLAGKVGMLPAAIALEIVMFYSRLEEAQTWLPRLREEADRPYTYGINHVLDPAIDAITGILPTLHEIEALAAIESEEGTPNIEAAMSAQEHENIQYQG